MVQDDKSVLLGMSGGVDSSTAAAVLMRAGYTVVGATCVFMPGAASDTAVDDARACAERLGIRHVVVDCAKDFGCKVVDPFVQDYAHGLTPIPCVGCNATCKIPALLQCADEQGCAKIATGHYARVARLNDSGRYVVKRALDYSKDQSYMLSLLDQDQLSRLLLPLGGTTKTAVRLDAADLKLPVAEKAESQDICFIEGDYRDFLRAHGVADAPGDIVTTGGAVVGAHTGLSDYTVGQRKGIGVAAPQPYYVIEKRTETNQLVVGFKEESMIGGVVVGSVNWQAFAVPEQPLECSVKLRYRSTAVGAVVTSGADGTYRVDLVSPQPTTAPGQIAVFSLGDTILGGGTIMETTAR